jgi:deoxyribodipyrimidine photolyase-like uncharacterized protein
VVADVWEEGYSHHITRLMILSNIASLLDVSPRELTDWFWVAYTDAYDWVVEPNVLGMGTFALGELMTTKPYVSGAAYINRMSDYCGLCAFDPRSNCPITPLYWAFLQRHQKVLQANPRLRMPYSDTRRCSRPTPVSGCPTHPCVRGVRPKRPGTSGPMKRSGISSPGATGSRPNISIEKPLDKHLQ